MHAAAAPPERSAAGVRSVSPPAEQGQAGHGERRERRLSKALTELSTYCGEARELRAAGRPAQLPAVMRAANITAGALTAVARRYPGAIHQVATMPHLLRTMGRELRDCGLRAPAARLEGASHGLR